METVQRKHVLIILFWIWLGTDFIATAQDDYWIHGTFNRRIAARWELRSAVFVGLCACVRGAASLCKRRSYQFRRLVGLGYRSWLGFGWNASPKGTISNYLMSHFRTRRLGSFEKRLTRPLILIQSKFQVGAQRLKLLQKRGIDTSPGNAPGEKSHFRYWCENLCRRQLCMIVL